MVSRKINQTSEACNRSELRCDLQQNATLSATKSRSAYQGKNHSSAVAATVLSSFRLAIESDMSEVCESESGEMCNKA